MATAEELLASLAGSEDKICVIDNNLRTINIPKTITALGVESDDEVHRLYFQMPRYIGETDLSTFGIRINYMNANNEPDIYVVEDKKSDGSIITFSWLVGRHAFAYKGNVNFIVCLKEADRETAEVLREYNTTVATLPVLEGLEVDVAPLEGELLDILAQLEARRYYAIDDIVQARLEAIYEVEESSKNEQANVKSTADYIRSTFGDDYDTTVKQYRTRANAIVETAQGETITISDSSDDYVRGLKVFGKTTQVTTTGKNLFDISAESLVQISATGTQRYGYTFSATGTYTFSCKGDNTTSITFRILSDGVYSDYKTYVLQAVHTVTLGENDTLIIYRAEENVRLSEGIYDAQLEEGTTATDYEPYSRCVASPSPEYSQALIDINAPEIFIYGSNLANANALTIGSNQAIDVSDDGYTIAVTGGADKPYTSSPIELPMDLLRGKTVMLKADSITNSEDSSGKGGNVQLNIRDPIKMKYVAISPNNLTAVTTIPEDVVRVDLNIYTNNSAELFDTANTTTVKGLRLLFVDSPWESYKTPQSIITETSIPGVPVTSGGNYTDANGQQWVCDEIDFERGVYIQRVGIVTLTGEENHGVLAETGGEMFIQLPSGCEAIYTNELVTCKCNYYPTVARQDTFNNGQIDDFVGAAVSSTHIRITDNVRFDGDHDALNSWIVEKYSEGNPVIFEYILAMPIETPLSDAELAAYNLLHTNYPNTVVLNDAGAHIELKYNADTQTYLENCYRPTNDQVQASVDTWLASHYTEAEGVSF